MASMYLELIRIRFLTMLAYRVNYYSGILIYAINIGAYYFIWGALYQGQSNMGGMDISHMTSYIAVAWMSRAFYFNNIDYEISQEVRDGKVATELIRPYNYLAVKAAQALGEGIFRLFFFALPGMFLVYLFLRFSVPLSLEAWSVYLLSLLFAFVINTQINLITGLLTFFFLRNDGFIRAKRVIVDLLSGLVLPISFYPDWAQQVMGWLPFQAITYLPSLIFSGAATSGQALSSLMVQVFWLAGLCLPIFVLWRLAQRNLVVQGG
jgi:ABC-2 type transport system permease protein